MGQRQHRCAVAFEAFADGLLVTAQPPLAPLLATGFQLSVQLLPTARTWNRDHEVAPRVTHQAFHLALVVAPVVALGRAAELIGDR